MKKIYTITILILFISFIAHAQYAKQNMSLLGHWFNPTEAAEPTYGIKYNSVFGWIDTAHTTEYAILGAGSGTYFIDLSDPTNPVQRAFVAGRRNLCIWREYKTYGKYLYAISDDPSPNSFQIIDMSYLPDSVHVVYDGTSVFERSHTLYIDGDKLYCGSVTLAAGAAYYSMALYSLANPVAPVLLRTLNQDYPSIATVHDMLVRNDTVYASCAYAGLFMYKYNTGTNTFSTINSLTSYPDQGYNHSSTISPNGHTLVFCDEVPANLAVKALDITDITNIEVASTFRSNPGATPHNPYFRGADHVVISYYQDGVQIFDVSDPYTPVRTGYFDTDTLHGLNDGYPTTPTYHGCWGAYVDLPSGIILASDMQNGLYVLNPDLALGVNNHSTASNVVSVYPNPTINTISVTMQLKNSDEVLIELFDITGRKLFSRAETAAAGISLKTIATDQLAKGTYILKITGKEVNYSGKVVKE